MAESSLFARLSEGDRLLEVAMNQTSILRPGGRNLAIGTKDLRGCSGIAVIDDAIILSHISPYPTDQSDSESHTIDAGLRHFADKMAEVRNLFIAHRAVFREGTLAWGIFARYEEDIPLDHHLQLAARVFSALGLSVTPAFYDIHMPRRVNLPPGEGTTIPILGRAGNEPQLYVEDELKRRDEIDRPHAVQQVASVSAMTSGTIRQPTQERWVLTGGLCVKHEGTTPMSSQQSPPINQIISTDNGQVLWNGREWINQPIGQSQQRTTSSSAPNASLVFAPVERWIFSGGRYVRYQGPTAVASQVTPPVNVPIQTANGPAVWNGRARTRA